MTNYNKTFLIPIVLLLMAFQCNRYVNYAEQTKIELTPNPIPVIGDSINFRIDIKTTNKVISRCNLLTYNIYLVEEDSKQLLDQLLITEKYYNTWINKQNHTFSDYSYIGIEMVCDKKDLKTDLLVIGSLKHGEQNAP